MPEGVSAGTDTSNLPDYWEFVHPEDRERVETRFRQHIIERGDERLHELIQYRLRRQDGSYVWVEAFGASVKDGKGYAKRFIASITDISARRAQEEALRNQFKFIESFERRRVHPREHSRLARRASQFGDLEPDEFVESITFRETRDYVKRVMANYRQYLQLYGGGSPEC